MQARMYRSWGFTLKETAALPDSKNLNAAAVLLKKREKALKEELTWQRYVFKHLRRYTKHLGELENSENQVTFTERPALYGRMFPPLDCSGYRHAYFEYWIPCRQL